MTKKDLVTAANELNEVLGLSPQIDTTGNAKEIKSLVQEAADFVEPEDKISDATKAVIKALKEDPAPKKKPAPKPDPEEEEEEEDEVDEEEEEDDEDDEEDDDEDEDEEEEPEPPKKKGKAKTSTAKKETKTPKETKKTTTIKEKSETPAKPYMAHIMDAILSKGGSIENIAKKVQKEAVKFEYDPKPFTAGRIRSHAKYRIKKGTLDIELTDDKVTVVE